MLNAVVTNHVTPNAYVKYMGKARILLLTTSYPTHEDDPSSVFLSKLAAALSRIGYTIHVLAPSDGAFFGPRTVNGVETHRFAYFWPKSLHRLTTGSGGVPENLARSRLARLQVAPMMGVFLLRTLGPARRADIMYANWLGAGVIGAAANLLTGRPLVISFRGDDGYLARDRPLWRTLTKWASGRASVIAPVSSEIADILADLGIDRKKIRLPRFGVDTDMFHPPVSGPQDRDGAQVLFVGSLIPRKGLADLLHAMAAPDLKTMRLTIVGDGYLRDDLNALATELGLCDRIVWKGLQTPDEVASLMRSSDMLCLPSYMEGTPNVVKEAMASGLPVIASRVGGVPNLVKDGETGLLFDVGDIDGIRSRLKKLLQDVELRRHMGRSGHEALIESGMDWTGTAEDFDDIFQSVMTKPNAVGGSS
jgi:L-malate glycosyltransferase